MKMKKTSILSILLIFCICPIFAQRVDTIEVFSKKMDKHIKNVVILPDGYEAGNKSYPVLYLLHGHGGRYDSWIKKTKTSLPEEATKWQMIIVCPDGQNSWYWDSPIDPKSQFDTYVSSELIRDIDKIYRTNASPTQRAVTGFSMGGHGGLWLGINHPDVFGACGSMSGGVDIRPFASWDIKNWIGEKEQHPENWENYTVITQLDKIKPNSLAIIVDCGKDDFFYQINENLHKEMLQKNIPHDYIIRPGGHSHPYWNNAVDYQLQFFSKFFDKN